ncbi:MAG: serine/threonine protein kinase [Pseudomonadota bacterium]
MAKKTVLKRDTFGAIRLVEAYGQQYIERDVSQAAPWARWLARRLALREARALGQLDGREGFPALRSVSRNGLTRSYVDGQPMYIAKPVDQAYFKDAFLRLRTMHRLGIVHNDLAKEPNWLVCPSGRAIIVDFQLAGVFRRRGRLFRMLAREDLRHFLKHKRTYREQHLTARERAILATPAMTTRIWRQTGKRAYLFITRRVLHWSDREGAADRGKH